MKKLKKALVCLSCFFLSGCSAVNFTVDGLLGAPKLTSEQSNIHQALIESVGSNITLKYPKNGDNRSAYVISNLDSDEGDEALVFYQYNSNSTDDNGLRINLLDKTPDGKWYSVKELAGAGTDIDKVILSSMGTDHHIDIIVGYQTLSDDDKTLEIYRYDGKDFRRVGMDTYSLLDAFDINSDNSNEIITIQKITNPDTGKISAKAYLLKLENDKITKNEGIDMCDGITSYVSSVKGLTDKSHYGIFVDGLNAEGNLQTEIIYYRYSKLQNPVQTRAEKLVPLCTRPAGYLTTDIDGDGIVEIPSVTPMTGYENAVDDEMVYTTVWSTYEDFYNLREKYRGYYSIQDGYFFSFPKRWKNQVTVKKDTDTGELVFFKYTGDINSYMEEIMRIAVTSKKDSHQFTDDGYEFIDSKGQLDYFVRLPSDKREQLILTLDEVKNNFYIMD